VYGRNERRLEKYIARVNGSSAASHKSRYIIITNENNGGSNDDDDSVSSMYLYNNVYHGYYIVVWAVIHLGSGLRILSKQGGCSLSRRWMCMYVCLCVCVCVCGCDNYGAQLSNHPIRWYRVLDLHILLFRWRIHDDDNNNDCSAEQPAVSRASNKHGS